MNARAPHLYQDCNGLELLWKLQSVRKHNRVLRGILLFQAAVIAVLIYAGAALYLGRA